MKKIFAFLAILIVGLSSVFAEVSESSSEHKMRICFDISEAFGFSTFPDMPGHNDFNEYYSLKDTLEKKPKRANVTHLQADGGTEKAKTRQI